MHQTTRPQQHNTYMHQTTRPQQHNTYTKYMEKKKLNPFSVVGCTVCYSRYSPHGG